MVIRRLELVGPAMAFFTTGVYKGIPILSNQRIVLAVMHQVKITEERECLSPVGYVIMPNHVHLLIGFPRIDRMSTIVRDFKRFSSQRVKGLLSHREIAWFSAGGTFSFWQRRFDDVIIHSEQQFRLKLNYIHQNPVRAGLVAREENYEYSSAGAWMGNTPGPIPVDMEWNWTEGPGT